MKSDIQISQEASMQNITYVFDKLFKREPCTISHGLETYGAYMGKIPLTYLKPNTEYDKKHLILVTSISPTKSGIGKTTVSIGLNDALRKLNKNSIAVLREPSLGPCFGMKGGACGGGYSQVVPMDKINLHFTGDFHAITTANNMIAAAIDNYFYQNPEEELKIKKITFRRCLDINDRSLRTIYTTQKYGGLIQTGFDITPASEMMAIFCMAYDIDDLRRRIDKIIIAEKRDGSFMYCKELGITGSIVALLSDAIKPNLVQSLCNNPVIVHGGPFANIAHGCNSVIATRMGLSLCDYVVTEAGFGSDLGAEKFFDIKCRKAGLSPDVIVLVATIPGLKNQGGCTDLTKENIKALEIGLKNLDQHLKNLKRFGCNVIVTNNVYNTDTKNEQIILENFCKSRGFKCVKNTCYTDGCDGAVELASEVVNISEHTKHIFLPNFAYHLSDSIKDKISDICKNVYGIKPENIRYSKEALKFIERYGKTYENYKDEFIQEINNYPICIAKTQYSFSDVPKVVPVADNDTTFNIDEIKINNGAEFLVVIAGNMMRMPGLPKEPAAKRIDFVDGKIIGLN